MEELGTISGALTLLANIVMAWNIYRLQAVIDQAASDYPDEAVSPDRTGRAQAHQHARHPDLRFYRLRIKPAPPNAFPRRRPRVELKKLTLLLYQ
jgi:hypothetical protein